MISLKQRPKTGATGPTTAAVAAAAATVALAGCSHPMLVVQRETAALAVVDHDRVDGVITGVGDMSHATVKFTGDTAWVISRDGQVSRIDVSGRQVTASAKVCDSGIGITPAGPHVAVACYAPQKVVILDADLKTVHTEETGSRNVGIKYSEKTRRLAFALMDKDEVRVLDAADGYRTVKTVTGAGAMPFDALLHGDTYVVGFFNENTVGLLDLATLGWTRRSLGKDGATTTLKVPHFGTWGIAGGTAFIPGIKEPRLHVLDLATMTVEGSVDLPGTPVFAVVSPDGRTVAVNFSGERENDIAVVDVTSRKLLRTVAVGGRVMHLRYSETGGRLWASSYFDNQVKSFDTATWSAGKAVPVPAPSGIFRN